MNYYVILLNKAFRQKEILHFAKPKWTKRGVFVGEEKKLEAKKLKESGKQELARDWKGANIIRKVNGHIPYQRTVRGKIQHVPGKGLPKTKIIKPDAPSKVKIYSASEYSQEQLARLIP